MPNPRRTKKGTVRRRVQCKPGKIQEVGWIVWKQAFFSLKTKKTYGGLSGIWKQLLLIPEGILFFFTPINLPTALKVLPRTYPFEIPFLQHGQNPLSPTTIQWRSKTIWKDWTWFTCILQSALQAFDIGQYTLWNQRHLNSVPSCSLTDYLPSSSLHHKTKKTTKNLQLALLKELAPNHPP